MVGMVGWTSGYTFPIYAVGDGLFMSRVMNSIAALSNSGVLASLGLLGLLLGLLAVSMRAIGSGGRQVELPSLFLAFIMYGVMFGGTASVSIQEVAQPSGIYGPRNYTVDNVPFGVAAMGWVVSNISYALTEKLEQAYALPNDTSQDVLSVGFNRSLDWLTAGRLMQQPDFGDTTTPVGRFRWDLVSYLRFCTPKALDLNQGRLPLIAHSADPYDTTRGIGFTSQWDTFPYLDLTTNSGDPIDTTCAAGIDKIKTYSTGNFRQDAIAAVAEPMGYSGSDAPVAQADGVWSAMGAGQDAEAQFYANHLIRGAMQEALAGVPIAGDMQVANALMVDTAEAQRATKFAGEESLWRRMVRPMMAFFESLVYIAAPFMALMVGLGGMGIKMVGRYAMATIWVSMWMPTLAAINMYQETMAGEFFTPFVHGTGSSGVTDHSLTSLYGSATLYSQLDDLIATGSLLVASTPAITAFLLFGSAYALNSLWSGMAGGEFVNQKTATPDAVNTPAAIERSALQKHDQVSGNTTVGATGLPTLSFSKGDSVGVTHATTAQDMAFDRMQQTTGNQIAQAMVADMRKSGGAGIAMSQTANDTVQQTFSEGSSVRQLWDQASSHEKSMALAASISTDATGSLSVDAAANWLSRQAGSAGGSKGGAMSEGTRGRQVGPSLGASGSVSANKTDSENESIRTAARLGVAMAAERSHSRSASAGVIGAAASQAQEMASAGYSETATLGKRMDFANVQGKMRSEADAFRSEEKETGTVQESQTFQPGSLVGMLARKSGYGDGDAGRQRMSKELAQMYIDNGGSADKLKHWQGMTNGQVDPSVALGAAALLAMNNKGAAPGQHLSKDQELAQDKREGNMKGLLTGMLVDKQVLGVDTGGAATMARPTREHQGEGAAVAGATAEKNVTAQQPINTDAITNRVNYAKNESTGALQNDAAGFGGASIRAADGSAHAGAGNATNPSVIAAQGAKIDAEGTATQQKLGDEGKAQISANADDMSRRSYMTGVMGAGAQGEMDKANSVAGMSEKLGGSGPHSELTRSQAINGLDAKGNPAGYPENPNVAGTIAAAKDGAFTSTSLTPNEATYLGTMGAVLQSRQGVSQEQAQAAEHAWNNMTPDQRQAMNDVINHWGSGHAHPGRETNASTGVKEMDVAPAMPNGSGPAVAPHVMPADASDAQGAPMSHDGAGDMMKIVGGVGAIGTIMQYRNSRPPSGGWDDAIKNEPEGGKPGGRIGAPEGSGSAVGEGAAAEGSSASGASSSAAAAGEGASAAESGTVAAEAAGADGATTALATAGAASEAIPVVAVGTATAVVAYKEGGEPANNGVNIATSAIVGHDTSLGNQIYEALNPEESEKIKAERNGAPMPWDAKPEKAAAPASSDAQPAHQAVDLSPID